MTQLNKIKILHTAIWVVMNVVILYLLYAVVYNKFDVWMWICVGIVVLECIILVVYKGFCPLTIRARTYSKSTKANFDIFLPEWLAKHNKLIYGTVFAISISCLIYKLVAK